MVLQCCHVRADHDKPGMWKVLYRSKVRTGVAGHILLSQFCHVISAHLQQAGMPRTCLCHHLYHTKVPFAEYQNKKIHPLKCFHVQARSSGLTE